jgi:tetratricopeptide (TPR) repeat protein
MRRPDSVAPARRAAGWAFVPLLLLSLALLPVALRAQGDARVSAPTPASEQPDLLVQGLDLEQQGKHVAAAALYRRALATPHAVSAMLGLERVYVELGWGDTVLAIVDSVIRANPRNPTYRTIQLRTLRTAGREAPAREAFERWVQAAPRDVAPFREWARLLLQDGRTAGADSVLQRAELVLGTMRGLATETAQLRAAMHLWDASARSWRDAVQEQDYLFQAAAFSLQPAPEAERPRIRRVLLAPPVEPGARRIVAALELAWGNAREGWAALRELVPDEAGVQAWRDFAELAEGNEAWGAAADAFAALYQRRREPELAARAARAALNAGLPATAVDVTTLALTRTDSARAGRLLVMPHVEALTALGRADDAARAARAWAPHVAPEQRMALDRAVAWGWVRAGDPARARRSLAEAGLEDDEEITGWLALYDGDVAAARERLRHVERAGRDQLLALAFLVRTRAPRAPRAGAAFLALARGDSATAARALEEAAGETADAAPLLLGAAARLHGARRDAAQARRLWELVASAHPASPEAAEADLELGRMLLRAGDQAGAIARWEHLILTYPRSALVPQARSETERARGQRP